MVIDSNGLNLLNSKLLSDVKQLHSGINVSNFHYMIILCHILNIVLCLLGLLQYHVLYQCCTLEGIYK